ncbi:NAD(P)/FAD-dependent oxidoreductase [Meiothermus sp. QL-1]|uniref:FAD-dependent oxidoreductase n=1 Tax=Meiothermus sp. QL-1 TaxID=2058095 RepID=UPI000E0A643D|nr:FAD/NAD(P)-binding oxidoreductase [Meiothermus sp. QL-1]RDI95637.1 NAD(P)/FAD-dependent oxidoreductase [Meiothermus sp. QL-1]
MKRREFIRFLSGMAALGLALPRSRAQAQARVVVVGAGWGGLGAVRALGGRVHLTVVEPNPRFMSCPLSIHYIVGSEPVETFQRGYDLFARLGVNWVRERVSAIDRERRVVVAGGERIPYDYLVLSPGVEYMEEAIPGYGEARELLPVGFRAFEQTAVKERFEAFLERGGEFVVSVPTPPYRCPPAPYERAMLFAERMRARRVRGRIILIDANPEPVPAPLSAPVRRLLTERYAQEIEYLPGATIERIDAASRRIQTSLGEVPFTGGNLVLPMRAPALIRQAGLGERWAAVRLPDFQSQADERIFIVGDAAGVPVPKAGHFAFGAGVQVGQTILARLEGRATPAGPQELPGAICWMAASSKESIRINVTNSFVPGEGVRQRIEVEPTPSEASGRAAFEWGRSMWSAMLG